MSNLPRFMIAENPLNESGREFVLHLKKPAMLIEVLDLTDVSEEDINKIKSEMPVGSTTEVNDSYFLLFPIKTFDPIEAITQQQADRLAGLMRRAADWWHAYIKFEEKNANESQNDLFL